MKTDCYFSSLYLFYFYLKRPTKCFMISLHYECFSQPETILFSLLTVIGQRLAAMNLLSPLAISDEFSTVRLQHNRAFTELLHAASSSLYPQVCRNISVTSTRGAI